VCVGFTFYLFIYLENENQILMWSSLFSLFKDYTGDNCTLDNLFAVLLGNKSALTGGSGKVVDSGPNDNIFIYYADHGAPGLVGKH
jgi:hypothetical protein